MARAHTPRPSDARAPVVEVAAWLQHHDGVISARDATRLGLSPAVQRSLLRTGRWTRVHRGVFVDVASPTGPRQAMRAALLAAGSETVLSHQSAAWLWDMIDRPSALVHLTMRSSSTRRIAGAVCHRSTDTGPARRCAGLAVTDPVRTLIDVAATRSSIDPLLERALDRRLVTVALLDARTRSGPVSRPGTPLVRAAAAAHARVGGRTPSALESRLVRLFARAERDYGIPPPASEVPCRDGRYRLDFAWVALRLAVEGDGYAWHGPEMTARDHARRALLGADGWTILVFTWHQVVNEAEVTLATMVRAYRRRAAGGPP